MNKKTAITKINNSGVLLVFPIKNSKEPNSLWNQFYPRSKMKWEWDDEGDNRVANLWHLMKELSDCREVVYSKWYQDRATFFSRKLFAALLKSFTFTTDFRSTLSKNAEYLLETLEMDSPLSTKELKKATELQGKINEPIYNRGTKELFRNFLTVGFGQVDDGAFPSLALGATKLLYEDLWQEAKTMPMAKATGVVDQYMPMNSLMRRHLEKMRSQKQ